MTPTIQIRDEDTLGTLFADLEGRLEVVIDDCGEDCPVAEDIVTAIAFLANASVANVFPINAQVDDASVLEQLRISLEGGEEMDGDKFAGSISE